MGYRDQKVIRDTRDMANAQFIGGMGAELKQGLKQANVRKKAEEKESQERRRRAAAATQGRYDQIAKYKKTGNKSLDEQVIKAIEDAALAESEAHMKAFGSDGTDDDIRVYQNLVATNGRDLNDLTMFIGTFDKDVDAAANAIAKNQEIIPGSGNFDFELEVQQGAPVEIKKGEDGRYSIFGATGGKFASEEIPLGKYYDDFQKNGTRYETIDPDYGLVMDEWSKSLIENADNAYKMKEKEVGKVPTSSKKGGTKTATTSATTRDVDAYKVDIVNQLNSKNLKSTDGMLGSSVKGGPSLSNRQIFYQVRNNLQKGSNYDPSNMTYEQFIALGQGTQDEIYEAFADQVIDVGTYRRSPISDVSINVTAGSLGNNITPNIGK
jgi:hypothetical protein